MFDHPIFRVENGIKWHSWNGRGWWAGEPDQLTRTLSACHCLEAERPRIGWLRRVLLNNVIRALAFCAALSAGHADAAVYVLIQGATATVSTPPVKTTIQSGISGAPAVNVFAQVAVGGNPAGGACTAQIVGSNDGVNWVTIGSAIAVTTGNVTGGSNLTGSPNYWGAEITALTGTGANCTVSVSG